MKNIIKDPKLNNINFVVDTFNEMNGYGVDIFYDMKKGRVFVEDYYLTVDSNKIKKLTGFSQGIRISTVTVEYVLEEIERIKKSEKDLSANAEPGDELPPVSFVGRIKNMISKQR